MQCVGVWMCNGELGLGEREKKKENTREKTEHWMIVITCYQARVYDFLFL